MYKGRYKVSDVCQLLDKSTFTATQTVNRVTFTNNGDGTITVDGTPTTTIFYKLSACDIIAGHKYLFSCGTNIFAGLKMETNDGTKQIDANPQVIFTALSTEIVDIYIDVYLSHTGPTIVKPQLFDLTEIFGAGNEPTTVAEFKEKFPDDLYPYSPYCWAKIKQMRYMTTTKNLFDVNKLTPYTPDNLPTNRAGVYKGNIIARAGIGSSICQSGKTLKQLCPDLVAGERYVLSYKTNATGGVNNIYLLQEERAWQNGYSIITTETSLNSIVCFYANYPETTVATISDFQIEKGFTATPYVPHGYLPLK